MNRNISTSLAIGTIASFFSILASHGSERELIVPEIRKIDDSELASLITWYDRETHDFEKDEIHEKIAVRLFEMNQDVLLKAFIQKSENPNALSELNEELLLAKVLVRANDKTAISESMVLLERILSVTPENVVKASWQQGDRSKTISARNSRRIDVTATPELAKQMDDIVFQQFSKSVLLDFNKTQMRAAELLITTADASQGTGGILRLSKAYETHPVAGKIFKDWLLNAVSNEK